MEEAKEHSALHEVHREVDCETNVLLVATCEEQTISVWASTASEAKLDISSSHPSLC